MCTFKCAADGSVVDLHDRGRATQKGRNMRPYMPSGAEDEIRTRDPHLGKVMLYP